MKVFVDHVKVPGGGAAGAGAQSKLWTVVGTEMVRLSWQSQRCVRTRRRYVENLSAVSSDEKRLKITRSHHFLLAKV